MSSDNAGVSADSESKSRQLSRENSMGNPPEREIAENEDSIYRSSSQEEDDLNLPPGRMHATRVKERLSGSGSLQVPPALSNILRKRVEGGSAGASVGSVSPGGTGKKSPRSRSRSPHHVNVAAADKAGATTTTFDANSSISSLDDIVDQDILYDRAGLSELEIDVVAKKLHSSREFVNLPPVNERLSEESMDDVHAFSDVQTTRTTSSNASRAGSIATGTGVEFLEPLNECGEEDEDDDDDGSGSGGGEKGNGDALGQQTQVILTNLDNISLNAHHPGGGESDVADRGGGTRGTGTSSLADEE